MPSEKTKEETLTQLLAEVVESARRVAFTEVMAKQMGNNIWRTGGGRPVLTRGCGICEEHRGEGTDKVPHDLPHLPTRYCSVEGYNPLFGPGVNMKHIRKTTFGELDVGNTFTCSRPEGVWQPEVYVKTGAGCAGTTSEPVEPVVVRERLLVYALPLPWRVFGMHGWWYIHRPQRLSMRIGPVGHRRVAWHARAQRMCRRHNRGERLYVFVNDAKFRRFVAAHAKANRPKPIAPQMPPPPTRVEMQQQLDWMYDQGLLGAALPRPPAEMVGVVPSEEPLVEQLFPPYLRHNPK